MTMFNLEGKVAVVFGGNGVLGRQFCTALLDHGARVYSCDIGGAESDAIRGIKARFPSRFCVMTVDASSRDALQAVRSAILEREKGVDILVNTTTMKYHDFYQPFEEVSLEGWNIGLLGNLTIPFLTIQAFVPVMKEQRSGSIINIASVYGIVGNDQRIYEGANIDNVYVGSGGSGASRIYSHGVYNAAKGGLITFTRYLAAYYGEYNIRVNCISPGGVANEGENEAFVRRYSDKVPLGRKALPDEMNGALVYLASDASSYVTGHNLVVDGGFSIW
ncbi:MAG: SDR family oxidoreductase [Methanomicrobiales archaeon]|nr:SDR family oxidoreductase [Methanomicrobiales archaeon]